MYLHRDESRGAVPVQNGRETHPVNSKDRDGEPGGENRFKPPLRASLQAMGGINPGGTKT